MGDTLTELRNNINFASISQFFHTFQTAFHPWLNKEEDYVFETEDLEKMVLDPNERNALEDLITIVDLVSLSTWQSYFAKEFDKRELNAQNPFHIENSDETANFFTFTTEKQVELCFLLCEWQLDDPERLRENLYTEEGSTQWRVDPVGYDKNGAIFWLFDDNRLYLETPKAAKKPLKKKKRMPFTGGRKSARRAAKEEDTAEEDIVPWQLLCCSIQDWQQIPLKYADSNHVDEKRFHELLVHDLLPKIIPILEDREKQLKKQEAIVNRKRSSRIMIRELEALEFNLCESRTRSSNRIEQKNTDREQEEKENLAKAREERVMERERRLLEREHRNAIEESKTEIEKPSQEIQPLKIKEKAKPKDTKEAPTKKKRGRKPKKRSEDEENWFFRCICGVAGNNLDDGKPMIACEKCNTWQHISCLQQFSQIDKNTKDLDTVSFTCQSCLRDVRDAHQSKKIKLDFSSYNTPHTTSSLQSSEYKSHGHLPNHIYLPTSQQNTNITNSSPAEKGDSKNPNVNGDPFEEKKQSTVIDPLQNHADNDKKHLSVYEISTDTDDYKKDTPPSGLSQEIKQNLPVSSAPNSVEQTTREISQGLSSEINKEKKPKVYTNTPPLDYVQENKQNLPFSLVSSSVEQNKQERAQDLFSSTKEEKKPGVSTDALPAFVKENGQTLSLKPAENSIHSTPKETTPKAPFFEEQGQSNTAVSSKDSTNGIDLEPPSNESLIMNRDI